MPPSPIGRPESYSPAGTNLPKDDQDDDEAPGLIDESDNEDFREPDAKRRRNHSDLDEDEIADLFAPTDDEDEDKVIQALILCGVDDTVARRKARDIVGPNEATFVEMYGRGSIMREANTSRRDLNVTGLAACDLRTSKPDGSAWDFTKRGDRKQAMDMIDKLNPYFVIGSPPCTALCAWNAKINFRKMAKDKV